MASTRFTKNGQEPRFFHNYLQNLQLPEFDFSTTHIERYLRNNGEVVLSGVGDWESLTQQLKAQQRVFRLTPRYTEMNALLDDGLHSAQGIVRLGPSAFVKQYSQGLGSPERAAQVFEAAARMNGMALAVFAKYSPALNGITPRVTPPPPTPTEADDIADWPSLFGSFDFCACEHCRSVYSPAAYLVDLLSFLKRSESKTAKDVLFARRPDIGKIELSCDNTNIPIPYIDLVNEVLENVVSPPPSSTPQPQTVGTPEELSANPQYVNSQAYDTLSLQVYPWTLPFDLWAEESRVYLENLGTQRYQLKEAAYPIANSPTLTRTAILTDPAIARAYLGMTVLEWQIIAGQAANHPIWQFWGCAATPDAPSNWIDQISYVPVFLKRSGLSYQELRELLATQFINPSKNIDIQPSTTCNLEEMTLASLTELALNNIHRFVRLQRKLGWTMRELDQAIAALHPLAWIIHEG